MWHVYVDTNVEHSCRTLQNNLNWWWVISKRLYGATFYWRTLCTVCS